MMTTTQTTIIQQARAQGINPKMWMTDGDDTVHAHDVAIDGKRRNSTTYLNVDISYNRGMDLYDVSVHVINRRDLSFKSYDFDRIYNDQLAATIRLATR